MNDFQKRRLAKLQKQHADFQKKMDQHLREGARLARASDKLMGEFRRFWEHARGVKG